MSYIRKLHERKLITPPNHVLEGIQIKIDLNDGITKVQKGALDDPNLQLNLDLETHQKFAALVMKLGMKMRSPEGKNDIIIPLWITQKRRY